MFCKSASPFSDLNRVIIYDIRVFSFMIIPVTDTINIHILFRKLIHEPIKFLVTILKVSLLICNKKKQYILNALINNVGNKIEFR